jgi:hypothetical protein
MELGMEIEPSTAGFNAEFIATSRFLAVTFPFFSLKD